MENKTAVYCRISTQMQSSDRQKKELLEYAERQGWAVDEENIYIDVISGYSVSEERVQYSKMLEDIEKKGIRIILFSELTRLGRNSVELLSEIQKLQGMNVQLYFQKQDLWIRDKQDLGARILLAVLAITTSYEIELFAERSISGKINKIHKGGGVGGDNNSYGYKNDENKMMVIREDEAEVVRRIFNLYANGKSSIEICDILNTEKIPTATSTRIKEYKENRRQKGLPEKEYHKFNVDELFWRPNMVTRMLNKKLYTGHRHVEFHKPQPCKTKKDTPKEIIHVYDVQVEDLRIITDELFSQVQERLLQANYNRNNAIKHENLLKHKIVCGECGSNFSVGKSTESTKNYESGGRTYKCYGRVNRKDKPQTCEFGAEVRQWKLDGLVLSLSLYMFAEINVTQSNVERIKQLQTEILEYQRIKDAKNNELKDITENYKLSIKRLSKSKKDSDEVIQDLIAEEQTAYLTVKNELETSISKYDKEIISRNITIKKLQDLSIEFSNIKDKMEEIRSSKELVKNMIEEYIDKVIVYKVHKMWNLVVVKYTTGTEFWGTIKSARYKKNEMFFDASLCRYGVEFHAWFLNNRDKCFSYNKETKTITYNGKSDIYTELTSGTYTFDEMQNLMYEKNIMGSFPFYVYEDYHPNVSQSETFGVTSGNTHIDWGKHNKDVLERIKRKH